MKTIHIFRSLLLAGILFINAAMLNAQNSDRILSSIKDEVNRHKSELKIDKLQPPFFISYMLIDSKHLNVNASLGTLLESSLNPRRTGHPSLLIGNYERNNLGYMDINSMYNRGFHWYVCLDDNPVGIATAIWQDLDGRYKTEAERYESKISSMKQQNIDEEDLAVIDFEKVEPVNIIQNTINVNQDKNYWEEYVKKSSAVLRKYPQLTKSNISAYIRNTMVYYYDTDNSQYAVPAPYCRLNLNVEAKTKDGQELAERMYVEHTSTDQMPDLETWIRDCETFVENFLKLLDAPMIDDAYSGPVLFEDQAAVEAVQEKFMNQQAIIAKGKLIGNDQVRQYYSGNLSPNNMEMMLNKKVISRSLSLKTMTGSQTYGDIKLEGFYPVDAEGVVPEEELYLIEDGVLKSMLNRRTPTKKIHGSNGHYRFNYNNMTPQIAPGNIVLTSTDTYSKADLKKKLLDAAKEEDFEYAYIVRRMWGNDATMVYRVYVADGREELVRGAKIDYFTLKSFKKVLGTADTNYVRHTANYGSLATYVVPDGILFEELEVTKNGNINLKKPHLVPKPVAEK